jgi:hypothetical protein
MPNHGLRVSFIPSRQKKLNGGDIMEGINTGELLKKPYLNEVETAAITGRALSTLRNERFLRRGLPYLKIGKRSIRYKTADILVFMEERRISFE